MQTLRVETLPASRMVSPLHVRSSSSQLDALSDDDWNNMRELIRSANNKDKADRS